MTPEMLEVMRTEIGFAIKTTVNGKIDAISLKLDSHNIQHEKDMERALPVIEAYESGQRDLESAKKGGRFVLWLAAAVTAIGGAYLVIRMIFFDH
jgi:hypothetical protein